MNITIDDIVLTLPVSSPFIFFYHVFDISKHKDYVGMGGVGYECNSTEVEFFC